MNYVKKEIMVVVMELQNKLIKKSNLYNIEEPNIVGGSSNFFTKRIS